MTDLLTRLALRAVGEGPQVRPRARPAFGGAEATDGDAPPDVWRAVPRAATVRRELRDDGFHADGFHADGSYADGSHAARRDAAARRTAPERRDRRVDAGDDGVVAKARDAAETSGGVRVPHAAPAAAEPPPRAVARGVQAPELGATFAFGRTPAIGTPDLEDAAPASAQAVVFAPAAHPAARAAARISAAADAVPAMPDDPHSSQRATELLHDEDDLPPNRDASFPPRIPTQASAGASRAANRRGAAPQDAGMQAHAASRNEPVVHVTIGRVEIRASVPAAPAAPRPAPAGPRPLSLGDYLAGRKGPAR